MSFLRRVALGRLRNLKPRGEGPKGGFFGEGHHEPGGYIFGETPPPAGQTRKWESWEAPWYFTLGAATAILAIGLNARPDSSLTHWAERKAAERLGEA